MQVHQQNALSKAQVGRAQVMFQQNPQGTLNALEQHPEQFEGLDDVARAKLISGFRKAVKGAALANPGSMGAVIGGDKYTGAVADDAATPTQLPGEEPAQAPAAPSSGEAPAGTVALDQVFPGSSPEEEDKEGFYASLLHPAQAAQAAGALPLTTYSIAQDTAAYTTFDQDQKLVSTATPQIAPTMQQAIAAKWQQLSTDPAGYVQQQNPDIANMVADGLTKNPAALPAAIEMQDRIYDALHIAPNERAILSVPAAQSIVSKLNSDQIPASVDNLEKMETQYGTNWPRIYNDLVRRGNLPVQFQAMMSIEDPRLRDSLARSYSTGETGKENLKKDFTTLLPDYPGALKAVNTELASSDWRNFAGSLSVSGVPDSSIAGYQDSVRRLTYQQILDGATATEAASSARKAFTDQYDFIDKARVPKAVSGVIQTHADGMLGALKADDLNIPAPNPTDDMRQQYLIGVRSAGRWITNQDGSGMVRQDSDGRVVRMKDGAPMTVPFTWPAAGAATPYKAPEPAEMDPAAAGGM